MELEKRCRNCKLMSNNMKCCSRCRFPYYCSRECQVEDWPRHKEDCKIDGNNEKQIFKKIISDERFALFRDVVFSLLKERPSVPQDKERIIVCQYILDEVRPTACFYFITDDRSRCDETRNT